MKDESNPGHARETSRHGLERYVPGYVPRTWLDKPARVRLWEVYAGQPFELYACAIYYKHRKLKPLQDALGGASQGSVRGILSSLGLYICAGCSHKTGRFVTWAGYCPKCRYRLCKECFPQHPLEHFIPRDFGKETDRARAEAAFNQALAWYREHPEVEPPEKIKRHLERLGNSSEGV